MTTRLYATNVAAAYSPAVKGAWSDTSSNVVRKLGAKEGAAATSADSETSASTAWKMLLFTLVVPILKSGTIAAADTIDARVGRQPSASSSFGSTAYWWVSSGATSTQRGLIHSFPVPSSSWATTAGFSTIASTGAAGSSLAVQAGDFLILEIGAYATSTVTTSRTATMHYGGTAADYVSSGSPPSVMGWFDFTGNIEDLLVAPVLSPASAGWFTFF